ncbi:hypothetical protein VTO42DRAFT_4930 [Malbranchea cinnamomea]
MASHIDNALAVGRSLVLSAVARLPAPAQQALQTPLVQKTLVVLLVLAVLRAANRSLSHWVLNNWTRSGPWRPERELVLLTGGCSGIGKQIMLDLARETGVRIVILDLNEPTFDLPPNVFFYAADVTSPASIKAAADQIRAAHGDPTILINNAGVGYDGTILDEPEDRIRRTFNVNTMSHFWMVREFLPAMVRRNHGHVVTIASMASFLAIGEMVDYCCTKASALAFHEGLTQELRRWYRAPRVRTSVIHPQWVRTPMVQQLSDAGSAFRMPIMGPEVVSRAVVRQIVAQRSGQVILPASSSGLSLLRAAPIWLQEIARNIGSGMIKDVKDREEQLKGALKKGE